ELRLRLSLELRVLQLDRDDGGEAFAYVLAVEALFLLQQLELLCLRVQRPRQRAAETGEVRAALDRVHVVGEREDRLLVRVVPLHRDLDSALVGLALEVDDVLVDSVLRLVDVRDEVADATLVLEFGRLAVGALVDDPDVEALREKRGLAEALRNRRSADVERLEHLGGGKEGDGRPGRVVLAHLPADLHVADWLAPLDLLPVDLAVATNLGHQPLRERVDHRHADAVQSARDLVALAAELAA